ncbi:MAG: aspartate--ammonia ligase [Odoribacter sp.]|nr:aspartate--ammonia ligase [Odoribacter sp.]
MRQIKSPSPVTATSSMLRTEEEIIFIKETFEKKLSAQLNLFKISSPIAISDGTGINDDLNGVEKPVSFSIKSDSKTKAVVVQSLAKWKRMKLRDYEIEPGSGILTDMRALRPDEELSPIHSIYVDQWDWEKHILPEQRTLEYLKQTVVSIYEVLKSIEMELFRKFADFLPILPEKISFIHAEELLKLYPDSTMKQRENEIARKHRAVFIIGIGADLSNGHPHDGRAPDYDDWSTINGDGYYGLNGDIIFWNPVINSAFEISSMGIRVDPLALERQLEIMGCTDRKKLLFHKMLLDNRLPLSIGGGIGQSRVCMLLLKKQHIGEVQAGIWTDSIIKQYAEAKIKLM